jgi:hypothetical protein
MFTKAHQMNPVHMLIPYYLRFILILFNHLHLSVVSGLFPSGFPVKILHSLQKQNSELMHKAQVKSILKSNLLL